MPGDSLHTEKELLRQVAEGDEKAFEILFNQWDQLLAAYVYRITGSRQLAEDVVQDVFLKIWMSRETLKDVQNFKAYLIVMARHHARNVLRSLVREQHRIEEWRRGNLAEGPFVSEDPHTLRLSVLDEAVARLPPQQQKVFLLHRYERLTYNTIAAMTGISKDTVKEYLRLATASVSKYIRSRLMQILLILSVALFDGTKLLYLGETSFQLISETFQRKNSSIKQCN